MQLSDIYRGITKATVVVGDTILFWKDELDDSLLQYRFPQAFPFNKEPDVSVKHLLYFERLGDVFHLPLSVEDR